MIARTLLLLAFVASCAPKPIGRVPPPAPEPSAQAPSDQPSPAQAPSDQPSPDQASSDQPSPDPEPLANPAALGKTTSNENPPDRCANECARSGRCVSGADGRCVAVNDADCRKSARCRNVGECTAQGGVCVLGAGDCKSTTGCANFGRCTNAGGTCQISCDDEKAVNRWMEGERDGWCWPDSTSCEDTYACSAHQLCGTDRGYCRLDDVGCAARPACKALGQCAVSGSHCIVKTDAHCRQSDACRERGECVRFGLQCLTAEQAQQQCGDEGHIVGDGRCVLPVGYDCAKECKAHNLCEAHELKGGFVVCIETAEFCRSQPACKQSGVCGVRKEEWQEDNKCGDDPVEACGGWAYGGCVKTVSDCAKSVDCRKKGNCSAATPSRYCRPTRAEHCEQSEICKTEGQCKLLDESSYHICGD